MTNHAGRAGADRSTLLTAVARHFDRRVRRRRTTSAPISRLPSNQPWDAGARVKGVAEKRASLITSRRARRKLRNDLVTASAAISDPQQWGAVRRPKLGEVAAGAARGRRDPAGLRPKTAFRGVVERDSISAVAVKAWAPPTRFAAARGTNHCLCRV